jgi:hypothetical protein
MFAIAGYRDLFEQPAKYVLQIAHFHFKIISTNPVWQARDILLCIVRKWHTSMMLLSNDTEKK